jgi:SAM-dependent methyltransferase
MPEVTFPPAARPGYATPLIRPRRIEDVRPACPFCGESAGFFFVKREGPQAYPVFRCPSCRGAFAWPRPEPEDNLEMYQSIGYGPLSVREVEEKEKNYLPSASEDARRIILRCRSLSRGQDFFDVGAGHGDFSKEAYRAGYRVFACEPSPNARAIYNQRLGLSPEAAPFDDDLAREFVGAFDVVLLSQVLEHIPDPGAMVHRIRTVLRGDGVAAVAVPHFGSALSRLQGRRDMYIKPPEHLNYFSPQALVRLFVRSGFRLERFETVSKIPRPYVQRFLRVPLLTDLAWKTSYRAMRVLDSLGFGMVLNAYFRKA